jgi:hypothetical protein
MHDARDVRPRNQHSIPKIHCKLLSLKRSSALAKQPMAEFLIDAIRNTKHTARSVFDLVQSSSGRPAEMQTQMETQSIPVPAPGSALVLDDSAAAAGPDDESAGPVHGDGDDDADDDSDGSRGEARDELFENESSTSIATGTMKSQPETGSLLFFESGT